MKILVVSLLRLGDIFMHNALARSLKQQYPGCEITFLVNESFSSAQDVLDSVDHFILFPREYLQKILVEQKQNISVAVLEMQEVVTNVNLQKFDLILNATHNFLSTRLMDLFESNEKRGVQYQNGKPTKYDNNWLKYFDDHFSAGARSDFHYLDVLHKALDVPFQGAKKTQKESVHDGAIYLQVLTSDNKKNWGLERFCELKTKIENKFYDQKVYVLCSRTEYARVSSVFSAAEIISPDLSELKNKLAEAKLLITGDTSVGHLAAMVCCPQVSLFLGSADAIKTSPYSDEAFIIDAQSDCYPCSHSQDCTQPTHVCSASISVDKVLKAVSEKMEAYGKNYGTTDRKSIQNGFTKT